MVTLNKKYLSFEFCGMSNEVSWNVLPKYSYIRLKLTITDPNEALNITDDKRTDIPRLQLFEIRMSLSLNVKPN